MEQLIILLLIGLISLINWIVRKSAEAREQRKLERMRDSGQEPEPEPLHRHEPEEDDNPDDSMRRLIEALGLPKESAPPPVPRRQQPLTPPPMPKVVVRPPVVPSVPLFRAETFAPTPTTVALGPIKPVPTAAATIKAEEIPRIRKVLSVPGGARDAIILSEVLGLPKALR